MRVAPKGASVWQFDSGYKLNARLIRSSNVVSNCSDSKRETSFRLCWLALPWLDHPILLCTVLRLRLLRLGTKPFQRHMHKCLLHGRMFGWALWCQNVGPNAPLRVMSSNARLPL